MLGEVVTLAVRAESPMPGTIYRQIGVKLWGEGAYEREAIDGSQTKYAKLFRAETGDIIVNKIWARNGSVAVVTPALAGCFGSGEFPMFEPKPDSLESRWVHWLTKTRNFWEQCDEKSHGTSGKNRIKPEQFLKIEIPLPSLSEQRRIVARIEELVAQINEASGLRKQAMNETEALLATARRVFIHVNNDNHVTLESVCSAIIDNLHSTPRLSKTGIPCIRSSDVGYGTLNLNNAQRTDIEEFKNRTVRGIPQENDIVFVREGGGTGKCAVVKYGQQFSLGQRVMMIRLNTNLINPHFFLHQLLSPQIQEDQIVPLSKGSASPHLNIGSLKKFDFILPSLSEQRRIVAELDALQTEVDALKRLQAETAAELDSLLPAVLDRAFKGEL